MKICLISFDFWNYDHYIVEKLREKNIDAHHIKMGSFSHRNVKEKVINALSKTFLNKNLKYEKRQQFVKDSLAKLGFQDQILILNSDTLDKETIEFAKKHTERLITYLYDNLNRFPVEDKLHLFDKIYSFDDEDVKKHGFEALTNYNYLPYQPQHPENCSLDLFYITSFDKSRNSIILPLIEKLKQQKISYKIIIVGKKIWKLKLKKVFNKNLKEGINLRSKTIPVDEIIKKHKESKAILDLMRDGQKGLSFRIFEAMALEKKIVTNNPGIKNYDFYNEDNILVIDSHFSTLDKRFFNTPYQKLPQEIYDEYALDSWVSKVFNL